MSWERPAGPRPQYPGRAAPGTTGHSWRASVGHEQPTPHLLLALRVELPKGLQLRAHVVGEAVDPVVVDLDQIAGRVAQIQLHNVSGQLDEVVAKRLAV